MRCAGCSKDLYCGKECQVAAWKRGHKAACANYKWKKPAPRSTAQGRKETGNTTTEGADEALLAGVPLQLALEPSSRAAQDIRGKPGCTGCGAIRGGHVSGCFCHVDGDPARDLRGLRGCKGCGKKQGCHVQSCKGVGEVNEEGAPGSAPRRGHVWTDEDVRGSLESSWTTDRAEAEEAEAADDAREIDAAAGRAAIDQFLVEDEFEWLDMWEQLPIDERRCLVRTVIPHLPTSLANTRCVCGCGDLTREAILCPEINLEGLVEGPTAPPTFWPRGGPDEIRQVPNLRLTVAGSVHKVMMWHALASCTGVTYMTQREHDVRDVVLIRRAQKRGLLPAPTSDRPWLGPLFFVGFVGPQALANGWTRGSCVRLAKSDQADTAKQCWEQGSHIDYVTYQLLNERQFKILQVLSLLADEFRTEWKRSHGGYSVSLWFHLATHAERARAQGLSEAAVAGLRFRRLSAARARAVQAYAKGSDAEQLHGLATALFGEGHFRDAYRTLSLAITTLHNSSTSDDDLSPSQYGLLAACLCKRAESALKMARSKSAQEDCHYALTLAGCFTENAPKAAAVSAKVRKTLSRCFETAANALRKDRALGGHQAAGERVNQTLQRQQQALERQKQASKKVKNSADGAGGGQDIQKVCITCGAADRDCFSKRQWAAKARSRRCLACSAVPAVCGDNGGEESAESEPVEGPIVPRAVLAAKVLDPSAYAGVSVYVEEECFVCMEAWDSPGMGASAVVLACNHAICLACMADWLSSSAAKDCPACRASVGPALAEVVLQHRDN